MIEKQRAVKKKSKWPNNAGEKKNYHIKRIPQQCSKETGYVLCILKVQNELEKLNENCKN